MEETRLDDLLGRDCPTHGGLHTEDECPDLAGATAAQLGPEAARRFLFGGNAVFTIVSRKSGARFTYKVQAPRDTTKDVFFVKVLTGPDNWANYEFLGTIFDRQTYRPGRRSRISVDAPSNRAFAYFFEQLKTASGPAVHGVDVYHEGRCGRCGRRLTVPESITTGFGPECAELLGVR